MLILCKGLNCCIRNSSFPLETGETEPWNMFPWNHILRCVNISNLYLTLTLQESSTEKELSCSVASVHRKKKTNLMMMGTELRDRERKPPISRFSSVISGHQQTTTVSPQWWLTTFDIQYHGYSAPHSDFHHNLDVTAVDASCCFYSLLRNQCPFGGD